MADNETRIKELVLKRGTIKGQLTAFKTFLTKSEAAPPHIDNITRRITLLKNAYEPIDALSNELQSLDEANEEMHSKTRFEMQESYLDLLDDADNLIRKLNIHVAPIRIENGSTSSESRSVNNERSLLSPPLNDVQQVSHRLTKLPDTPIPQFSGEYDEWLPFKDSFMSIIDGRAGLTDTDKLHFLKGAMKGRAVGKLRSLTMVEGNYHRAWSLLERAYADKRLIVSKHLNTILNAPVLHRESSDGLQKLADDTTQNLGRNAKKRCFSKIR